MKIVVLDGRPLAPERADWAILEDLGELEVYPHTPPELLRERSAGAEVLVTNKARIGAEILGARPGPRLIALTATGYDCVDVATARRLGIPVSNVPEYSTPSVAQYVFALLLELCHQTARHGAAVQAGEWTSQPDFSIRRARLVELEGKTMGIVGFGRIGRRVGRLAEALGMRVIHHGRTRPESGPDAESWRVLNDLLAESDVISLHCPMSPETAGLINRDRLALLKPTAFLINTARGPLVNEADLAAALVEGRLAGAALDVVSAEPIRVDNPLLHAPNCLITPHIAWATDEARERLMKATAANIAAFLAGRPINVVNPAG